MLQQCAMHRHGSSTSADVARVLYMQGECTVVPPDKLRTLDLPAPRLQECVVSMLPARDFSLGTSGDVWLHSLVLVAQISTPTVKQALFTDFAATLWLTNSTLHRVQLATSSDLSKEEAWLVSGAAAAYFDVDAHVWYSRVASICPPCWLGACTIMAKNCSCVQTAASQRHQDTTRSLWVGPPRSQCSRALCKPQTAQRWHYRQRCACAWRIASF